MRFKNVIRSCITEIRNLNSDVSESLKDKTSTRVTLFALTLATGKLTLPTSKVDEHLHSLGVEMFKALHSCRYNYLKDEKNKKLSDEEIENSVCYSIPVDKDSPMYSEYVKALELSKVVTNAYKSNALNVLKFIRLLNDPFYLSEKDRAEFEKTVVFKSLITIVVNYIRTMMYIIPNKNKRQAKARKTSPDAFKKLNLFYKQDITMHITEAFTKMFTAQVFPSQPVLTLVRIFKFYLLSLKLKGGSGLVACLNTFSSAKINYFDGIYENSFKECVKNGILKFQSLRKFSKCFTKEENTLLNLNVTASEEAKTFERIEKLYNNKDLLFYFELEAFNKANNQRLRSRIFRKYAVSRLDSLRGLNKSKKCKDPKTKKEIPSPSIDDQRRCNDIEVDEKYVDILDSLSYLLALNGIFYNNRNPFWGNAFVFTKKNAKTKKDECYEYKLSDALKNDCKVYYYKQYNIRFNPKDLDKLSEDIEEIKEKKVLSFLELSNLIDKLIIDAGKMFSSYFIFDK